MQPEQIIRRWIDDFNRGTAAGLYADDGVLLATFFADALHTRAPIESYFKTLAERGDLKVTLDEDSVVVQALGGDCYALSGRYVFQVGADAVSVYPSRFTFVVDVSKERPILHHHSSRAPSGLPDAAD